MISRVPLRKRLYGAARWLRRNLVWGVLLGTIWALSGMVLWSVQHMPERGCILGAMPPIERPVFIAPYPYESPPADFTRLALCGYGLVYRHQAEEGAKVYNAPEEYGHAH